MPALRADAINQRVLSGGRVKKLGGLSERVALVEEDQAGRSDDRANQGLASDRRAGRRLA